MGGVTTFAFSTVIQLLVDRVFPATDLKLQQRAEGIGRRMNTPSALRLKQLAESAALGLQRATVRPDGISGYHTVYRGGSTSRRCRLSPLRCDCFDAMWHGKSCIHTEILRLWTEAGTVPTDAPLNPPSTSATVPAQPETPDLAPPASRRRGRNGIAPPQGAAKNRGRAKRIQSPSLRQQVEEDWDAPLPPNAKRRCIITPLGDDADCSESAEATEEEEWVPGR